MQQIKMENKNEHLKVEKEVEKYPVYDWVGQFVPPSIIEGKTTIVTFQCPNGHNFTKTVNLK